MAASTCRSRGRGAAPRALKRQISAFLSGAVPPSPQRLPAHRSPPRCTCPFSLAVPRAGRELPSLPPTGGRSRGGVAGLRSRTAEWPPIGCVRTSRGPAPPSVAHAPWSWRAGSLPEREEPRRATGPRCPDCRCRPARQDPPSQTPTPFGSARAPHAQLGRRDGRMSGGRRKEEPPQPQLANGALKVSVWSKVLRSDAAWDDKVRKARRGRTGPGLPRPSRPGGRGSREQGGKGAGAYWSERASGAPAILRRLLRRIRRS